MHRFAIATIACELRQASSSASFFSSGTLKSTPVAECMMTVSPSLTTLP